jgi:hypothetical protein
MALHMEKPHEKCGKKIYPQRNNKIFGQYRLIPILLFLYINGDKIKNIYQD